MSTIASSANGLTSDTDVVASTVVAPSGRYQWVDAEGAHAATAPFPAPSRCSTTIPPRSNSSTAATPEPPPVERSGKAVDVGDSIPLDAGVAVVTVGSTTSGKTTSSRAPGCTEAGVSEIVPSGPRKRIVPDALWSVGFATMTAASVSCSPPLQTHVDEPAASDVATAPAETSGIAAMRCPRGTSRSARPTDRSTTMIIATPTERRELL